MLAGNEMGIKWPIAIHMFICHQKCDNARKIQNRVIKELFVDFDYNILADDGIYHLLV